MVVAGLFGIASPADPDPRPAELIVQTDPRLIRVRDYFIEKGSPAHLYAADFIHAADRNNLDWRLLPSISMIESGGGKAARNNNIFGWDNCNQRFRTTREGIYRVASRLRHSPYYRNKNVEQILRVYNPNSDYCAKVTWVMQQLGPADLVPQGVF
jgi:hypothetical protein